MILRAAVLVFGLMPGALQSADIGPGGFTFDIHPDVPAEARRAFQDEILLAEDYFRNVLGLGLSDTQKSRWRIEIGTRPDSAVCCNVTRDDADQTVLAIHPGHPGWAGADQALVTRAMFADALQTMFGDGRVSEALALWLDQGMGAYYANDIAIARREITASEAERDALQAARASGALDLPLSRLEDRATARDTSAIGYLAVLGLVEVSPNGKAAPFVYVQERTRLRRQDAFQKAFGISLIDFYAAFEAWRRLAAGGDVANAVWSR